MRVCPSPTVPGEGLERIASSKSRHSIDTIDFAFLEPIEFAFLESSKCGRRTPQFFRSVYPRDHHFKVGPAAPGNNFSYRANALLENCPLSEGVIVARERQQNRSR